MPSDLTPHDLEQLLRQVENPTQLSRALLVMALQDYPDLSTTELAEMIAIPYDTARSWQSILDERGPEALLAHPVRRQRTNTPSITAMEVDSNRTNFFSPHYFPSPDMLILGLLTRFRLIDPRHWLSEAQAILTDCLPQVDATAIIIRTSVDLVATRDSDSTNVISRAVDREGIDLVHTEGATAHWHVELLQRLRTGENGLALWDYSLPIAYDFFNVPHPVYIGSIYFFRKRSNGPFHSDFRQSLALLIPLLRDLLIQRIMWLQHRNPFVREFGRIMQEVTAEAGLTRAEEHLLGLILQQSSEAEILQTLKIRKNTFRNHLHSIYGKMRVSNRGDLFGSIFVRHLLKGDADH